MHHPFAPTRAVSRRDLLSLSLAATALATGGGASLAAAPNVAQATTELAAGDDRRASQKRYKMRKSINLWAFPYPQRMSLEECLRLAKRAGFDAI